MKVINEIEDLNLDKYYYCLSVGGEKYLMEDKTFDAYIQEAQRELKKMKKSRKLEMRNRGASFFYKEL